jgi:hypothetical protein
MLPRQPLSCIGVFPGGIFEYSCIYFLVYHPITSAGTTNLNVVPCPSLLNYSYRSRSSLSSLIPIDLAHLSLHLFYIYPCLQ